MRRATRNGTAHISLANSMSPFAVRIANTAVVFACYTTMDDPDLDPIDETANPDISDSDLSDVDETAYEGVDPNRLGEESEEDEGPNIFAIRPAKVKTGTGERKKKPDIDTEEKRRKRQERIQEKEEAKQRRAKRTAAPDEFEEEEADPNQRPEDPEAARRWDLDRAMEAAVSRKQVKRRKKDDEIVSSMLDHFLI